MSKYKKLKQASTEIIDESMKIARATQKPNQTKEQTKLIAQGIQKGMAEYKKQQKGKARELGKLKKQLNHQKVAQRQSSTTPDVEVKEYNQNKTRWLPWGLLVLSWLGFALSFTINK